ncbi:hypothetical protein ACFU66_24400, partial [Streptomyces libani]
MGHPAVIRASQPLEEVTVRVAGPPALTTPAAAHLRALGATLTPRTPGPHTGPAAFEAAGAPGAATAYTT